MFRWKRTEIPFKIMAKWKTNEWIMIYLRVSEFEFEFAWLFEKRLSGEISINIAWLNASNNVLCSKEMNSSGPKKPAVDGYWPPTLALVCVVKRLNASNFLLGKKEAMEKNSKPSYTRKRNIYAKSIHYLITSVRLKRNCKGVTINTL